LITIKVKRKVALINNNINLGETIHDLLDKWALEAYECRDSNIQTLLSYKLAKMQSPFNITCRCPIASNGPYPQAWNKIGSRLQASF
jgi:hypothetical protein